MQNMTLQQFEDLVSNALDTLAPEMLAGLDNVIFVVQEKPADGSDILGVYEGFSIPDRSSYGYGEEPDRIILFKDPLLNHATDLPDLEKEIRITLIHEIGHYYGLSEERLHELGWA